MVVRAAQSRRRRALALVEMAIVLPLLILLTSGVLEYSWMFLKAQVITNAAREGARAGVLIDGVAGNVVTRVHAAMVVAGLNNSGYTLTLVPPDPTSLLPGEPLSVTVSVLYDNIDLGLPLIPTPNKLNSTMTMAREGETE